jgi:signal transduction histidine kinase
MTELLRSGGTADSKQLQSNDVWRAMLNILDDVSVEQANAVDVQRAILNILDDVNTADAANEDKNLFISHVSHELRSPLTVISQFNSLLLDGTGGALTDEQHNYLIIMDRNITQLTGMINDLLSASRIQIDRMLVEIKTIALFDLLMGVVESYQIQATKKQLTVKLVTPQETLPPVQCDPLRVREVLMNIVDNAFRFTPMGGIISISAGVSDNANDVWVAVTDTGSGIKPQNIEKVFEQFFQEIQTGGKSRYGLGLGLYLSRNLIRRQRGKLWATSTVGQGSTFIFTLPLATGIEMLEGSDDQKDPHHRGR